MKNKKVATVIYTYRYMWKSKAANGKYCIQIVSGVEQEHKEFMSKLNANDDVLCASRIYLHEINVLYTEQHEIIKKEEKV